MFADESPGPRAVVARILGGATALAALGLPVSQHDPAKADALLVRLRARFPDADELRVSG